MANLIRVVPMARATPTGFEMMGIEVMRCNRSDEVGPTVMRLYTQLLQVNKNCNPLITTAYWRKGGKMSQKVTMNAAPQ